jgi:hypothetical protein
VTAKRRVDAAQQSAAQDTHAGKLTPVNGIRDEFAEYYPVIMAFSRVRMGAVPE